ARVRLAEELAPDLLARQDRREVPVLLLLRARVDDRGPGPADPDGVGRPGHAGPAQLLVDHQLEDRVRLEPPGPGPVRGHVAGLGQPAPAGPGVGFEPGSHLDPAGVALRRQLHVHLGSVGSPPHASQGGPWPAGTWVRYGRRWPTRCRMRPRWPTAG